MNLLVLGPQGSGKGTQAKRLAELHDIPHVSTGDMFREASEAGTELGRQVQPILAAGDLVPDQLTVAIVRERLEADDARAGFVLDGFPRTIVQAEALDETLREIGQELDLVLFFDLDDVIARERLVGRAQAEGRTDDTPESISRRLELYHQETAAVVERYRQAEILVRLNAERSITEVAAEIDAALEQTAVR